MKTNRNRILITDVTIVIFLLIMIPTTLYVVVRKYFAVLTVAIQLFNIKIVRVTIVVSVIRKTIFTLKFSTIPLNSTDVLIVSSDMPT